MAGIKDNIDLMKNFLGQLKDGDVDINNLLANASASDYDDAASVIRDMNDFKAEHPLLSKFGNTQLVDYIDNKAYDIASSDGSPTRSYTSLTQSTGNNYSGSSGAINWSDVEGRDNPNLEGGKFDLLRAYLDPSSNTLPESDVKPSSWTKGDPAQGWRSIKDYSVVEYSDPNPVPDGSFSPSLGGYTGNQRAFERFHESNPEFVSQLSTLQESVADGTYDPSKHAIKLNVEDEGGLPPGMTFQTDIDVANFTQSIGYDTETKEYYMSVTDVWDFEPDQYKENWGVGEVPTEVKFNKYATKGEGLFKDMPLEEQASYLKNIQDDVISANTQYTIPNEHIQAWGSWQNNADATDNIINGLQNLD